MSQPIFGQPAFETDTPSVTILSTSQLVADCNMISHRSVDMTCSSSVTASANVKNTPLAKIIPIYQPLPRDLTGTDAVMGYGGYYGGGAVGRESYISITQEAHKKGNKFKFVEIKFTYKGNRYDKAFYTEKEIDISVDNIERHTAKSQKVLLEKITYGQGNHIQK